MQASLARAFRQHGRVQPLTDRQGIALNFKTEFNGFADALHEMVERFGLRMATWQGWHRGHIVPGTISFNNHIKLVRHTSLKTLFGEFYNPGGGLQANGENLTSARSRIQDADFAAETTSLSRAVAIQTKGDTVSEASPFSICKIGL